MKIPLCHSISSYSGGASDALAEVRVDGRPRHRLQPLQLPRRGHVEPLDHVVDEPDRQDHRHEYRRRQTYHEQRPENLAFGFDQLPSFRLRRNISIAGGTKV